MLLATTGPETCCIAVENVWEVKICAMECFLADGALEGPDCGRLEVLATSVG